MPKPPDTTPRPAALDDLLAAVAEQLPPDDPEQCAQTLAQMTTPTNRTALNRLRNLIGDALTEAGGVPDTFPVMVNARAGFLADTVLLTLSDLLSAHARELAEALRTSKTLRDLTDDHMADVNAAAAVLDGYADDLDAQATGGES